MTLKAALKSYLDALHDNDIVTSYGQSATLTFRTTTGTDRTTGTPVQTTSTVVANVELVERERSTKDAKTGGIRSAQVAEITVRKDKLPTIVGLPHHPSTIQVASRTFNVDGARVDEFADSFTYTAYI